MLTLIHVKMSIYAHMPMNMCTHAVRDMYTQHMHTHTYTHTHIYTHSTCTHTYLHTHTHTHTEAYTSLFPGSKFWLYLKFKMILKLEGS